MPSQSQGPRQNDPGPVPPPKSPDGQWMDYNNGQGWTWVWNGSWSQNSDGTFTWNAHKEPDPNLVKQWGHAAVTDVQQDPTGVRNKGSWHVYGKGAQWVWGDDPNQNDLHAYSYDELTDPDHLPNNAQHPSYDGNKPPPPDVVAPELKDTWGGVAPDVTGKNIVSADNGSGSPQQVTSPPHHAAYLVQPGGIRDVENTVLAEIDANLANYDSLKTAVANALPDGLYMPNMVGEMTHTQDRLLLNVGDTLELTGQFTRALNNAAQLYARADLDSFLPADGGPPPATPGPNG
ncbi:hypothetical protein GCM10023322_76190 [Rugosimonospora acidiphila]|uniref:Uncharacterized protein n=1 Tax=Rugosimonospora acidiphila TaxID=556531 RepID=A0ABP9SSC4_9ACTN